MPSSYQFRPDWVSPPGDTIADILRERRLSVPEFAQRMGCELEKAKDLLQGRATVTLGTARRLEQVLGPSVEFWMSRDFQYREDIARLRASDEEWLAQLPVGDMIKFGWLKRAPHPADEVDACLRFFDVPSVFAWRQKYTRLHEMAVFRTTRSFDSRPAAVAAWLRQGEIESEAIGCDSWNPKRFEESLPSIRRLTYTKDPSHFIPKLRQLCA